MGLEGFARRPAPLGQPEAGELDHEIVKDDLEAAIALANEQGKLVLVNFTGHT